MRSDKTRSPSLTKSSTLARSPLLNASSQTPSACPAGVSGMGGNDLSAIATSGNAESSVPSNTRIATMSVKRSVFNP